MYALKTASEGSKPVAQRVSHSVPLGLVHGEIGLFSLLGASWARVRESGALFRLLAPVDLSGEGEVAETINNVVAHAPGDVAGPVRHFEQVFDQRGVDPLPLRAVPLLPEVAFASRLHDVAHCGRIHVPAAMAEDGRGAEPVAPGDGGIGDALQQRRVDRGSVRVHTCGTAAHQAHDGPLPSACSTRPPETKVAVFVVKSDADGAESASGGAPVPPCRSEAPYWRTHARQRASADRCSGCSILLAMALYFPVSWGATPLGWSTGHLLPLSSSVSVSMSSAHRNFFIFRHGNVSRLSVSTPAVAFRRVVAALKCSMTGHVRCDSQGVVRVVKRECALPPQRNAFLHAGDRTGPAS